VVRTKRTQAVARPGEAGLLKTLLGGASALALGAAAWVLPTQAQAQDQENDVEESEVIVVTGIRASVSSAQEIKRDAEVIVDSITAVDIGALPDRSVTEALQRVSGVAIARTPAARDPVRFAAEGSGVVVRGMTQVRGEFNGRDSFTANNGRGLSFEDVPPELMAGVDVYKNPSADMIEGGIGGLVNLRTRMPFDADGQLIALSIDSSYGDFREEWAPSYSILYSNRWDTPIGEIGLLVDFAHSELATRTDTISIAPYWGRCANNLGDINGDPSSFCGSADFPTRTQNPITGQAPGSWVFVPGAISWRALDWDREREGTAAAIQWSPTNELELYVQFIRSAAVQESRERAAWSSADGNSVNVAASGPAWEFDSNGNFVYGGLTGGNGPPFTGDQFGFGVDSRYAIRDSETTDISGGFILRPTDRLSISGDVQYVEATTNSLDFTLFDRIDMPSFVLDLRNGIPDVTFGGGATYAENPSNYWWFAAMDHHDDNEADELAGRLDIVYDVESDWVRAFRAGVRHSERELINRESNWNWGYISEWWGGNPLAYFDGTNTAGAGAQNIHLYQFPNFMRGEAGLPSQLWFPDMALLEQGPNDAYAFVQQLQTGGWGWAPFNGNYANQNTNSQREQTDAGYFLVRLGGDNFIGSGLRWDGNVGARYVETRLETAGFRLFPGCSCTPLDATTNQFLNGTTNAVTFTNEYENWLPSFNLRLHLTDEVQLRFAASRAIARPDFSQLQAYESVGLAPGAVVGGLQVSHDYVGTSGNPALRPMEATQYDVAIEWYFDDAGSLYTTLFYKEVENYFANVRSEESITNNGVTRDVTFTRPRNVAEGTIQGFEIGYQQFYDFLPGLLDGLGLQANFTYVDSEGGANVSASPFDSTQIANSLTPGLPLEGLSRTSYNVALLYERGPVSGRLAYNWRERYLLTTSQANDNNAAWAEDYGQLDGSVFYQITDNFKIGLEAANLLHDTVEIQQESFPGQHGLTDETGSLLVPHHWIQADTRYTVVLRATW
jgi:TonB-dependent receptor